MAVYRVLGDHLVSENEFAAKGKDIVRAMEAARAGAAAGPSIRLDSDDVFSIAVEPVASGGLVQFTPVKFGEPLTVDIRHIYSGNVGTKGGLFSSGNGDIAIVSGVKEWSAFKASARALNWVVEGASKRQSLGLPSALEDGCRLIAYQKAVATRQVIVSVELASAPHQSEFLQLLGKAFGAAAGLPIMMPYAGALLAAGQIIPAAGKLLESITGGHSEWAQSEELNFGLAGTVSADAGFRVIARGTANLEGFRFKAGTGLVDRNGQAFAGDDPYVVIAVDGESHPELDDFTPVVAGAELMRRFRLGQTGQSAAIDDLLDLTTIISDVKFRSEAESLKKKMAGMSAADQAKAKPQLDALIKNIIKAELRP